jgi:hypothetical protein
MSLYGSLWTFLVSIAHVVLIRESNFGAETLLDTQNVTPEKVCVIEKLSSPCSKENGNIVISNEAEDNCLGTINLSLFWTSLSMVRLLIVIVVHVAYSGHFLQKAFVTSPKYCPLAQKNQVSYTQLDSCYI